MPEKQEEDKLSDDEFVSVMAKAFMAVALFALVVVAVYILRFAGSGLSNDPGQWGQFGDYLGGVINPAVGVVTVFLIVASVTIQRRELRASLKEMQHANESATKMSFEQSLFAWLENYHSQIREIEHGKYKGRKVLLHLYNQCLSPRITAGFATGVEAADDFQGNQTLMRLNVPGVTGIEQLGQLVFRASIAYQKLYLTHKSDLDAPFRTLYRLIRWIDRSPLTNEQKWHYATLVRSQLSWPELVFLYYNGLILEGEKMSSYANKFALYDNLVATDELIRFGTYELTECDSRIRPRTRDGDAPWPYAASAFNSVLAKKSLGIAPDA